MVHLEATSHGTLRCLLSSIQNLIPGTGGNGSREEPVNEKVLMGDSFVFNVEGVIRDKFGDENSLPNASRMTKWEKAARKSNNGLVTTMETFNATNKKESVLLEDGTTRFKQMRVLSSSSNLMGSASVQLTPNREQ